MDGARRGLVLGVWLAGCGTPPPDPVTIGITAELGSDLAAFEAALSGHQVEVVRLYDRVPDAASVTLDKLDALILGPGADVDPALYGELVHPANVAITAKRQAMDLSLIEEALSRDMPVLAVCLGAQELSVHLGGSLIQDLPTERPGLDHRADHEIVVEPVLHALLGERATVRSRHHQAVDHLGSGLVVGARSSDGVIEATTAPEHRFVVATQFHPESQPDLPLWSAFVAAARLYEEQGPAEVVRTEPGQPAPAMHRCEEVRSPFAGERRSIEALGGRKIGNYGDYRASYVRGHKHGGIDLAGDFSEPVYAICEGRVVDRHLASPHHTVVVEHLGVGGETFYSSYKHVEEVVVAVGDLVGPETRVGRLFTEQEFDASPFTRRPKLPARGNHLHFEMRRSIADEGRASWTAMDMEELGRFAFDPWPFFEEGFAVR